MFVVVHPVLHVKRAQNGTLTTFYNPDVPVGKGGQTEFGSYRNFEQNDPKIIGIITDLEAFCVMYA